MSCKIITSSLIYAAFIMSLCFTDSAFAATRTERAERYNELIEESSQSKAQQGPKVPDITRPVVEYQAGDLRDPFKQYVVSEKAGGRPVTGKETGAQAESFINSLQIQGIIWGGRFPQAIVNEKIVKVGDSIGEARIIEIKKDGITLFMNDRNYSIPAPASGEASARKDKKGGQ